MKKLYLFLPLLLAGFFSQAQINKGTILLGGGVSVYTDAGTPTYGGQAEPKTNYARFSIAPAVGLAIRSNLVLGVDGAYSHANENPGGTLKEQDYSFGIFVRKYKYLGSRFYFYSEPRLGYFYDDQKSGPAVDNFTENKQSGAELSFAPGVAYSLNRHWQLEVAFPNVIDASYEHTDYTQVGVGGPATETKTGDNIFNLSTSLTTNFQLQVGVRYLIGG